MTDDDARVLADDLVKPFKDLVDRVLTLVERLTARLEVLELEHWHKQPPQAGYDEDS